MNCSTGIKKTLNSHGISGILREFIHSVIHLIILIIAAGKICWINAWVCFGMSLLYQVVNTIVLMKVNPQLLNKRGILIKENTKNFDKIFITLYIPFALSVSVIAGFDAVRYSWSHMSFEISVLGIVIYVLACMFALWAMVVNPHFEATVIIQNKEHQVCTSGPYKVIRHPGYAAAIIGAPSYPLILGSWWGLVPTGILILLFIIRTTLEDCTLQKELSGYSEYANRTRYRLVPFVW
ncbi:MAG: isoprenylcysteine carboxylmethyltransferase family protein [Thermodesulfobacteriota bacterium]|nr:isoprenylcysteine carboxylmethyltransferase family protein [Thermodesulfobacteriota bacterium]